jgi:hypothetical protein
MPQSRRTQDKGGDVSEEPGQRGDERVAGEAPQPIRGGQSAEHVRRVGLQVLHQQNTDPFGIDTVRSWPAQS